MKDFERRDDGDIDEQTKRAATEPTVVEKLREIVRGTRCGGCPKLDFLVDTKGANIDKMREAAANPEFFDRVQATNEASTEHTDDDISTMGVVVIGDMNIGTFIDPDDDPAEQTGHFFTGILDMADELEEAIIEMLEADITTCPGALNIAGHDPATRQLYDVTICSDPEFVQENEGVVPARVDLKPDVG